MNKNWAYRDLDFNFIAHPITGDVSAKTDNADVQQSLRNLVLTSFYERGFNVEFGCGVGKNQLFENFTPLQVNDVRKDVEVAIGNFEPRVDLISVDVGFEENFLQVSIRYNILNNDTELELFIKLRRVG